MNLRAILSLVRDELDALQITARFEEIDAGVIAHADDYASLVIAKRELRARGITVIDQIP